MNDEKNESVGKSYAMYRQRQLSFPSNSQLLFKLDEHEEEEDSESEPKVRQVKFAETRREPDSTEDEEEDEESSDDGITDENFEEIENEKNSSTSDSFEVIK